MEQAKVNGSKGIVYKLIMSIVVHGRKSFAGEDQRTVKYKDTALLSVGPRRMHEAQVWMNNEHVKSFKIKNKLNHETIVPEI